MERLTTTSDDGGVALTFDLEVTCYKSEMLKILKMAEKLKTYEDAEEQGLLLRLLCKVGTPVYVIDSECEGDPFDCYHCCESCGCNSTFVREEKFDTHMHDEIGKTVFLTKEEAEKELAKSNKENEDFIDEILKD